MSSHGAGHCQRFYVFWLEKNTCWPNVRQKGELCTNIGGLADKYLPWPDGGKVVS